MYSSDVCIQNGDKNACMYMCSKNFTRFEKQVKKNHFKLHWIRINSIHYKIFVKWLEAIGSTILNVNLSKSKPYRLNFVE